MCLNRLILEESVFAIPTEILWKLLTYTKTGLITGTSEDLNRIAGNGLFLNRSELEEDPSFKQLIPYAIITHNNSFYLFTRTSGQTEKRLHNQVHLGVGGHMNPGDPADDGEQFIIRELKREFFEEVNLLNDCRIEHLEFIGFINDESIPVGLHHIGLLFIIQVSSQDIIVKETDKMTAKWVVKSELLDLYEGLETWTKIAVDYYFKQGHDSTL